MGRQVDHGQAAAGHRHAVVACGAVGHHQHVVAVDRHVGQQGVAGGGGNAERVVVGHGGQRQALQAGVARHGDHAARLRELECQPPQHRFPIGGDRPAVDRVAHLHGLGDAVDAHGVFNADAGRTAEIDPALLLLDAAGRHQRRGACGHHAVVHRLGALEHHRGVRHLEGDVRGLGLQRQRAQGVVEGGGQPGAGERLLGRGRRHTSVVGRRLASRNGGGQRAQHRAPVARHAGHTDLHRIGAAVHIQREAVAVGEGVAGAGGIGEGQGADLGGVLAGGHAGRRRVARQRAGGRHRHRVDGERLVVGRCGQCQRAGAVVGGAGDAAVDGDASGQRFQHAGARAGPVAGHGEAAHGGADR